MRLAAMRNLHKQGRTDMRASHQIKALAALVLVIILLLAGCAKPSSPSTPTATPTPITPTLTPSPTPTSTPASTGPYGELRIAINTFSTEAMDPIKETGGIYLAGPHSDYLFRLDGTKTVPGIAERWEVASDGQSWTIYIRHGVKFQNLTEVTAKDVKFSLERFASKDAASPALLSMIDRVELVDDFTVRVYTKGTQPFLPMFVSMWSPSYGVVMPKDYIERNGLDYYKRYPIGVGPYKMARYVPGDMAQYQAFEQYWRGASAFKALALIKVPEETTRVAMLKTGEIDAADMSIESATDLERAGFKTYITDVYTPHVLFNGVHDPKAGIAGPILPKKNVFPISSRLMARESACRTLMSASGMPAALGSCTPLNKTCGV